MPVSLSTVWCSWTSAVNISIPLRVGSHSHSSIWCGNHAIHAILFRQLYIPTSTSQLSLNWPSSSSFSPTFRSNDIFCPIFFGSSCLSHDQGPPVQEFLSSLHTTCHVPSELLSQGVSYDHRLTNSFNSINAFVICCRLASTNASNSCSRTANFPLTSARSKSFLSVSCLTASW